MNATISVIISNYNYEKYIAEAIESVLVQTHKNFELIIVDDGSIDNSRSIIEEYQGKYPDQIKAIFKENGGQASAFNVGFAIAEGEIISFLDADDYWYPDKLETVAYYHKTHEGIQHNLSINNEKKFTLLEDGIAKQQRGLERHGFMGTIPTSGLSFTKKALDVFFPIPEKEYRICADLYVKILFLNYHDIFSIDTPKGCYRSHDSNQWFNSQASSVEYNKITLDKLNEVRRKEQKEVIIKGNEANAIGGFMLDHLSLYPDETYVIYGMGELAKYIYGELKDSMQIKYFSGSFVKDEDTTLLGKEVKTFDYIQEHQSEYDKVIIASVQVNEIQQYLLENGFTEAQLVVPKL